MVAAATLVGPARPESGDEGVVKEATESLRKAWLAQDKAKLEAAGRAGELRPLGRAGPEQGRIRRWRDDPQGDLQVARLSRVKVAIAYRDQGFEFRSLRHRARLLRADGQARLRFGSRVAGSHCCRVAGEYRPE